MNKPKKANVICAALFVGALLSFSFYFCISAVMEPARALGDSVSEEYGIPLSRFSDAYYGSSALSDFIGRCEYLIFGGVGGSDVILGKEGFLFDAGEGGKGYNYLKDYLGVGQLTSYELQAFTSILDQRKLAYKNKGADYLLVVIPNSQTVYGEYMPSYIGPVQGSTRLEQLTNHLHEGGYDFFYNAAEALIPAKHNGVPLYNNTENSLNSLGEWYVYSAVCNKLASLYSAPGRRVDYESLDSYVSYTDGRELARRAGLEGIIKNKTISFSSGEERIYRSESLYGSMVRTEVFPEYLEDIGMSGSILLEFTDNWDRVQMMPFFSASFAEVTYKSSHQFSDLTLKSTRPGIVVQFIHEYELYSMISDYNLNLTYNAGMNLEIDPSVTASPILISQTQTGPTRVVVAGQTEAGAFITVSGEGIKTVGEYAVGSLFFIEVDIGERETATLSITARLEDKLESKVQTLRVRVEPEYKKKSAAVGGNSQLYPNDYTGYILLGEKQLEDVRAALEQKISRIANLGGTDTEYIYVIVPDKLAVYPENLPDSLRETAAMVRTYREMAASLRAGAGMSVIDLTEEMLSHKVLGQLYYQTGELWTDLGAYVGYHTLMSKIAQKHPGLKLLGLNDFDGRMTEDIGGELVSGLGFDGAVISESYLTLLPDYGSRVSFEQSGGGDLDTKRSFISYNDDGSLPVAIVTRDAYGTGMLISMAQNFSKMIVMAEDEHTIPDELIESMSPDYIITIRRNGELS